MLINSLCGKNTDETQGLPAGRQAHGAQEHQHIWAASENAKIKACDWDESGVYTKVKEHFV